MSELDTILNTALLLADQATRSAKAAWMQEIAVAYKGDGSALTDADLAIERQWRGAIAAAHPSHSILGEEFGHEEGSSAFTWVLDPIDGTRQFATGLLNFASLIAVCRDGVPMIGVIDVPLAGGRFIGAQGQSTTFNNQPIQTSGLKNMMRAKVSVSNPESFAADIQPAYQRLAQAGTLRVYDGGSPAYGALSRGLLDVCINGSDLDAFDICALVPVVAGAGGAITDWRGQGLGLNASGPIAASASKPLHDEVLVLLNDEAR